MARVAGVSYQTVSRVINGHSSVSADARERVETAIGSLGYRPSRAARALAHGMENVVTVLTSNTSLFGYAQTLAGIEEAARTAGVRVAIRVLSSDDPDVVEAAVEQVSDPRSGAVIVLGFDRAGARALAALPAVVRASAAVESYVGRRAPKADNHRWTWFDDTVAAERATAHLLDLGHATVHHMAIPSSSTVGDRQRGWQRALRAVGAPVPPVIRPESWTTQAAHAAALEVLGSPEITAVLCGNDDQALGVLRAAHDLGLSVPGDLSVVGFDDIPGAPFFTPALTTVRFDFAGLGRRAFEVLGIGHDPKPEPSPIPQPTLIIRESSGPAATRRPTSKR
ncbi:LacI family DNA-binding transcriptional regulator [Terrabacter sp. GCM10012305]